MTGYFRHWLLVGMTALSLALVGCASGDKGGTGGTGAAGSNGSPGAPGAPASSTIQNTLTATITGASVNAGGNPVVTFMVVDQNGLSYVGLACPAPTTSCNTEFTVAKLIPSSNGDASYWQDYIVTPGYVQTAPATAPVTKAATENTGTLTYNASTGVYTYTYATNITSLANPTGQTNSPGATNTSTSGNYWKSVDLSYQPGYTTRVGFEIRGTNSAGVTLPYANPTFDFVPDGSAGSGTRYIVATDVCNQCHNQLQLHGGARIDAKYCPTCHNPGNMDAASTTLDFKQLIHRVHIASSVPSVVGLPSSSIAGAEFGIYGHSSSPASLGKEKNFSTDVFPQMIPSKPLLVAGVIGTAPNGTDNATKNPPTSGYFPTCEKCHGETTDAQGNAVTDAAHWRNVPTMEACTSCHDNVSYTGSATGSQILHGGSAGLAQSNNSNCAGCHSSGATTAPIDKMHAYANNIAAASSMFQYQIGAVTLDTSAHKLTAVVSVINPATGAFYDIQQDPRFCRATFFVANADGLGDAICKSTTGSLTLGIAIGAAEHSNGNNGSIITPASIISLNLLNPLNYTSATQTDATGAYSGGGVAQGNPTPPAVVGTVAGTACGTSTVNYCTFLATVPLPPNAVSAIQSAGSFTVALYGAPSLNYIANNSINVLAPSFGATGKSLASGVTSNTCNGGLNGVNPGSPATIGTPALNATAPCVTVSVPVAAVTADFGGVPGGGCGGPCTLSSLSPGTKASSGRRIVVVTDTERQAGLATGIGSTTIPSPGNGNTGGSCDTCHGMLAAHGGSRAGNAQLCIMCHNANNTDLDQRPTGAVGTSIALDGLREHPVDFKVMIHGIHAGATTASVTGVALAAEGAWSSSGATTPTVSTPTIAASTNGQMRQTGLVIYGFGHGVFDFSSVYFPGLLDNCTNCHASGTFTLASTTSSLPLPSVVLPTTATSVPAAQNQWEAQGHTMTLGSTACATTTAGVNTTGNVICMQGANYTVDNLPLVVTAYGTAAALPACNVAGAGCPSGSLTANTPYYVVGTPTAGNLTTVGTYQLAASAGGTAITITGAGAGTFAIGPANMNVAAQGDVWSPTVAVCTSCHDSEVAAQHMLETGNALFSPWPAGTGTNETCSSAGCGAVAGGVALGVIDFDHIQPYSPSTLTTNLTKGTPATPFTYLGNQAAGYGPGIETCALCHGPGGTADVSVVHPHLAPQYQ